METDDHELLRAYVRDGAQEAFAALVQRHLGLVFSAARRQVESHDLAQEVTQLVFITLAREGRRIGPKTPVAAWLYLVTRRTALNLLRSEARRQAREQAAVELAAMKSEPPEWPRLEPWLDEAMASLNQADGSALLLRFFENKSLREVGAALGISEDAAQKRVSRALDQLRTAFGRRGVAVTAAGLATQLSAHAIVPVPAGIGAAVSTATAAALAAPAAGMGFTAFKTLAMTTLQKNALAATLALAAGAALYEGVVLSRVRAEVAALQQKSAGHEAELARLRATEAADAARLAAIDRDIDARLARARDPQTVADAAALAQLDAWYTQLARMQRFLAERPELNTPELQLVPRPSWMNTAMSAKPIDTEEALREAIAQLRNFGVGRVAGELSRALQLYLQANDNQLPGSPQQLLPFLPAEITPQMLARFEMLHTGKASDLPPRADVLGFNAPVDMEFDNYLSVGMNSHGGMPLWARNFQTGLDRFAAANPGLQPKTAAELAPYLKWPMPPALLQKQWDRIADQLPKGNVTPGTRQP